MISRIVITAIAVIKLYYIIRLYRMNLIEKIIKLLKCCKSNNVIDEVIEVAEDTNIILHK